MSNLTENQEFMVVDSVVRDESFYKPVTRQEMETLNLFKSNLFKLQISELVKEVKVSSTLKLVGVLSDLKRVIEGFKNTNQSVLKDISKDLNIPMDIPKDLLLKFQFMPPKVSLVGSWLLKTSVKQPSNGGTSIDFGLEMPECLFQEKDYTNYR